MFGANLALFILQCTYALYTTTELIVVEGMGVCRLVYFVLVTYKKVNSVTDHDNALTDRSIRQSISNLNIYIIIFW